MMTTATSPDIAESLAAACTTGSARLARLLAPLAGAAVQAEPGSATAAAAQPWGEQLNGPCLAWAMETEQQALLALLPLADGLLLHNAQGSEETVEALKKVTRELHHCALPTGFESRGTRAAMVPSGATLLHEAKLSAEAAALPIALAAADSRAATLWIVGFAQRADVLGTAGLYLGTGMRSKPRGKRMSQVPNYVRSLLRIDLSITVTLAAKKLPVADIMELAPGAMIQFDKPCEEQLEMEVNGRSVGRGEAVKVGDKFGIRLTSLILPGERLVALGG